MIIKIDEKKIKSATQICGGSGRGRGGGKGVRKKQINPYNEHKQIE